MHLSAVLVRFIKLYSLLFRVQRQDTIYAVEKTMPNLLHKGGDTVSSTLWLLVGILQSLDLSSLPDWKSLIVAWSIFIL